MNMRFKALVDAGECRDGGSLEAVFEIGDGQYSALCLKATMSGLGGIGSKFTELYWFSLEHTLDQPFMNQLYRAACVEHGSSDEQVILQCLAELLVAPVVLPPLEPPMGVDDRLSVVRALYAGIPERKRSPPLIFPDGYKI